MAEDYRCPECGCPWRITSTDLDRIIAERTSRGWGEHIRLDAVVVECG